MKLLEKTLPDTHEIVIGGDSHEGNLLVSYKAIDQCIDYVNGKKNRFFIHMGDVIEGITVDDPRYDLSHHVGREEKARTISIPLRQAQAAVEVWRPVQKKTLVMLDGNHTLKLWKHGEFAQFVCEELGVEYGSYTSVMSILDGKGKPMYKMFLTHGFGSITSMADSPYQRQHYMERKLKMLLQNKMSDCLVMCMGHTHKLIVTSPLYTLCLYSDREKNEIVKEYTRPGLLYGESYNADRHILPPDFRWYANTGSFLKLYNESGLSGYQEVRGFDPIDIGYVIVKVENKQVISVEKVTL